MSVQASPHSLGAVIQEVAAQPPMLGADPMGMPPPEPDMRAKALEVGKYVANALAFGFLAYFGAKAAKAVYDDPTGLALNPGKILSRSLSRRRKPKDDEPEEPDEDDEEEEAPDEEPDEDHEEDADDEEEGEEE